MFIWCLRLVGLLALMLVGTDSLPPAATPAGPSLAGTPPQARQVIGYLVGWEQRRGFATLKANPTLFTEISPFWYTVDNNHHIVLYQDGSSQDPELLAFLRQHNIKVTPTIANVRQGVWDAAIISEILNDPQKRIQHINDIVQLVVVNDYDGIDIDYEALFAADRDAFSSFVSALADALHAKGKQLSVAVYAKVSEPGHTEAQVAHDWIALGKVVDQVRIMVYDYHYASSAPGPLAPLRWAEQVTAFAAAQIPKEKIVIGLGLYGYDWAEGKGVSAQWSELIARSKQYNATISYDANNAAAWFQYVTDNNVRHTVWFEDARSVASKLDLVTKYNLAGVHFWHLGGEDPATWLHVEAKLVKAPRAPVYCRVQMPYIKFD